MNIALLTAAGSGSRTRQDIPKQFLHVDNKPIIIYTLEAFQKHPNIDAVIVVVLTGWVDVLWAYAKQFNISKLKHTVLGGETGQESIYAGLSELKKHYTENDVVMIHDGNRPMVPQDVITDSFVTFSKYGNAVAAVPCTEVVCVSENGFNSNKSIPRETLFRTQTPHTYRFGDIFGAHQTADELGIKNTSASCALFELLGKETFFSKGSELNLKITTTDDLEIFKALLNTQKDIWIK